MVVIDEQSIFSSSHRCVFFFKGIFNLSGVQNRKHSVVTQKLGVHSFFFFFLLKIIYQMLTTDHTHCPVFPLSELVEQVPSGLESLSPASISACCAASLGTIPTDRWSSHFQRKSPWNSHEVPRLVSRLFQLCRIYWLQTFVFLPERTVHAEEPVRPVSSHLLGVRRAWAVWMHCLWSWWVACPINIVFTAKRPNVTGKYLIITQQITHPLLHSSCIRVWNSLPIHMSAFLIVSCHLSALTWQV